MRSGLTRFFTSITLMLGITTMLSIVKKEGLFIERPKLEVSDWEVMDQRTKNKLFMVVSQGKQNIPSVFSNSILEDSLMLAPRMKNNANASVY